MIYVSYFKDLLESVLDYRKFVISIFINKNDVDLINKCGSLKSDINRPCLEFENIIMEQIEEYLYYIKNEEEAHIERISNR